MMSLLSWLEGRLTPRCLVSVAKAYPSRPISIPNMVHLPNLLNFGSLAQAPSGSCQRLSTIFTNPASLIYLIIWLEISNVCPLISPAVFKAYCVSGNCYFRSNSRVSVHCELDDKGHLLRQVLLWRYLVIGYHRRSSYRFHTLRARTTDLVWDVLSLFRNFSRTWHPLNLLVNLSIEPWPIGYTS